MTQPAQKHKKPQPALHTPSEFGLDVLGREVDLFSWFLLVYLLGKPIRSTVAIKTWRLFRDRQLDTPWAIYEASDRQLVQCLQAGGYTRYQHVMTRALKTCMDQLIRQYDGSINYLISLANDQDELSKILQKLYGVGPKTAEIFMRETDEFFARRVE